ncbi:MAG TPA: alpha,alpha-trehalose-phosphate synthase (UDP-forming) [Solimonas sp.]|nr:alpha,alpha-trehalose-phosphate synthase (UDP-forming) [Solimonas sp.]
MSGARLVAVSNRVVHPRGAARGGGLAVALIDALRERGGLWFGWSGKISQQQAPTPRVVETVAGPIRLATVDLTAAEHEDYYNGFANRSLWPLFHLRLDLAAFDRRYFDSYMRVNHRLAQTLWPMLREDDRLWVHDYHLLPFAEALRERRCRQPIGFFLHIPFPVPEVLSALPHYRELLRALFSYDLLGFQTEDDVQRFRDCVLRECGGQLRGDTLTAFGRRITARAFPIGIDAGEFAQLARSPGAQQEWQRARYTARGRTVAIGVDRLDYTKGIPERFQAIERLLENYPDAHGQVELLQIAPTSRGEVPEYMAIREQLEKLAGHINGRFSQIDWTPIRYINRPLGRRQLAGLYRASRIGLVTPLRDGMNLVAKEYVAAQDPADPGVLVLSRFAGAARQMAAALLVNPFDTPGVSEALQTARHMSLEERRNRHTELMTGLLRDNAEAWRESFLRELERCSAAANVIPRVANI